jgi:hypothetical protein
VVQAVAEPVAVAQHLLLVQLVRQTQAVAVVVVPILATVVTAVLV